MQTPSQQNFRVQLGITILSVVLFATKIIAYFITNSLAILTDALESIVNVLAGFIGLYSLYVAAKPKDNDHPYGHGKAEFVSSAVEGTLIIAAGILIIVQTVQNLVTTKVIASLDLGLILIGITGVINYAAGYICINIGKRNKSIALESSGRHLQLDTYSTLAIIIGLVVIIYTKWIWLDSIIAMAVSGLILYNGYRIIRKSLAGIMDEADGELLQQFVTILNNN
ncbi:MAG: cation transporter, partial [Deinococcales bacterium]|nr:cation transporter [Chitinophagaceae bacterium]